MLLHLIELGFEFPHDLFELQVGLLAGTLALSRVPRGLPALSSQPVHREHRFLQALQSQQICLRQLCLLHGLLQA